MPRRDGGSSASRSPGAFLLAERLSLSYGVDGGRLSVLDEVSICVERGEWLTVVGPSGCGKTTLLRVLAGLATPDTGHVVFDGVEGTLGRVAYLPQSDTLLPWRTALGNAILAAEIAGGRRDDARDEARRLFAAFGLAGFEDRHPAQLSGGMRQRLAIVRTFLTHCDLLLLDEPLGALDPLTRATLQAWLLEVWGAMRKTVVLVTHDVEEAVFLSDRVSVLSARPARVRRTDTLSIERPRTRTAVPFVAARGALLDVLLAGDGEWR